MNNWQHFHHVADIGVRGVGASPEQAFAQAAVAMTAVITDPEHITNEVCIDVQCEANDLEYLFIQWMNALVYEMATRKMLFAQFDVAINGDKLSAKVCGEPINVDKHQPAVEIKGATMTELKVWQDESNQWNAQCVVDV